MLACASVWVGACGHTKSATDPAAAEGEGPKGENERENKGEGRKEGAAAPSGRSQATSAERSDETGASGTSSQRSESSDRSASRRDSRGEDIPVAASAAGLLKPGAAEKIEERLIARGLLEPAKRSGQLGGAASTALRRFQRDAKIAETGVPDHETVRRLGLSPDDVFRAAE